MPKLVALSLMVSDKIFKDLKKQEDHDGPISLT